MRSLRPCFAGGGEYSSRFVDGEGVIVAEGVAVLGEFRGGYFGDQLFSDEADVIGAAVGEFWWDGVRGEERGDDSCRAFFVEAAKDAEHFELGVAVEAVAGFGFDGGGAGAEHPVAMAAGGSQQLIFSGGSGERDGSQDASAGSGDLLVSGASDALFEFSGAVACEDEMSVGIDEAGGYGTACGVDFG